MGNLVRTKSGFFDIETAVKTDKFKELLNSGRINEILISKEHAVSRLGMNKAKVLSDYEKLLINGNALRFSDVSFESPPADGENIAVFDNSGALFAIYEYRIDNNNLKAKVIL